MNTGKRVLLAALASAFVCFGADLDRSKPPQTPPVPDIKLPTAQRFQLGNGLTVIASPDERYPLTTIRLAFLAGSKYDPKELPGLSDSVAGLLNQGTEKRSAKQIALESADMGGQIDAASSHDLLTLQGSCLSDSLPQFLALFADVAQHASFPADEVELQKQNRLQRLRAQYSDPDYLGREALAAAAFGSNPYSHVGPTEHSLSILDAPSLKHFRDAYLVPNNAYLVIVGRIPEAGQLRKLIEQELGGWTRKQEPAAPSAAVPANSKKLVLVDRPGSVQANIMAAHITPQYGPDFFPLIIADRILGGGTNARLFVDIREKRGFAYDAHTETDVFKDAGTAVAVTQVRNEVFGPAMDSLNEDLQALGKTEVTPVELSEAKASYAGRFIMSLEKQSARADELARINAMGWPADYLEMFMEHVRSVEPDAIRRISKTYWNPDDATVVVVGDASKVQKTMEKLGPVTVKKVQE